MDRRNSQGLVLISSWLFSLPLSVSARPPAQGELSQFLAPVEVPNSHRLSSLPVFRNSSAAIHDPTAGVNGPHVPAETSSAGDRPISWRLLVPNILHDQVAE